MALLSGFHVQGKRQDTSQARSDRHDGQTDELEVGDVDSHLDFVDAIQLVAGCS